MKLLKIGIRLTGILVTTAVLLSAVSLISRRAEKNFEKSGAYTSDLLVWEQEYPDSVHPASLFVSEVRPRVSEIPV